MQIFDANFRFEWILGFVVLRDAALSWRPKELSCRLKSDSFRGIWLSEQFVYLENYFNQFLSSSRDKFTPW